jgi:predicted XRE-type DNA-binding protein
MKHRSALMMAISEHVKAKGLNQTEAAKLFAVSQPRISDLMRGKIGMFSIDTLVAMLAAAGIGIDMRVRTTRARTVRQTAPKAQSEVVRVGAKAARRRAAA